MRSVDAECCLDGEPDRRWGETGWRHRDVRCGFRWGITWGIRLGILLEHHPLRPAYSPVREGDKGSPAIPDSLGRQPEITSGRRATGGLRPARVPDYYGLLTVVGFHFNCAHRFASLFVANWLQSQGVQEFRAMAPCRNSSDR